MRLRKRLSCLPLIFCLLSLLSCKSGRTPENQPGPQARLQREIPELMKKVGIPGLSIALIRNGRLSWSGTFGVRSVKTGEPITEDTMFEAASLTKPVTAFGALRLYEQGRLDLDKPLAEYLAYPHLEKDSRYRLITARMVLTHTSGLPNWGTQLIREPGRLWGYSGEGFLYLGRTIEKITGLTLQEFLNKELFGPFGMGKTSYVWNADYEANGASGHDRHGNVQERRKTTQANGGASLLSTPRDYARFMIVILSGQGLKKETIDKMLAPQVRATEFHSEKPAENIHWGMGWGLQPAKGGWAFWHWGDNGDLRGYAVACRNSGAGLVFYANSENLFAVAESLVSLLTDERQWSFSWLPYRRFDSPQFIAQMSIENAFVNDGLETGLRMLKEQIERSPDMFDEDAMDDMAQYLDSQKKKREAAELLKLSLEAHPRSPFVPVSLGMIYLDLGETRLSLETLEKALRLNPKNETAQEAISWVEEARRAAEKPVSVPRDTLEKYAGDYGPSHVTLRDGRLYCRREGKDEYEIVPLSKSLFALVGYGRFRVRFVEDDEGRVTKIVGLYFDGRQYESPRNR